MPAQHGRHADLRGPTELGVLDGRRHLVGDELGMGEDLGHRGHRLGPEPRFVERLDQLLAGPAPVGLAEPGLVAGPQLGVGVDRLWVHGSRPRISSGVRVGVSPFMVAAWIHSPSGTFEERRLVHAGRIRLGHHAAVARGRALVLLPDLCRVRQDPLIERGLHVLPATALLTMDQRREHAGGQQEAGGHARGGKVEEHGPGPPTGLLVLHAGAGLDRCPPNRDDRRSGARADRPAPSSSTNRGKRCDSSA